MKRRVFFGLGSNLGDRLAELRRAVAALPDVVNISSVYETEPVGFADQDMFFNIVVECFTDISASDLLQIAQSCEVRAQRVRTVANGPRTLDVDILLIDGESHDTPDLVVPHPRIYERNFVVEPLREIAPDIVDEERARHATGRVAKTGPFPTILD